MKSRIRELYENYLGVLEPWQIKLAIGRLRRFHIPLDAWEDTMQEMAVVILDFKFDEEKAHAASEETILCRRLDNCIRMLARSESRRRKALDRFAQLRQPTEDDRDPSEAAIRQEEGELLNLLVNDLDPELQEVCRLLIAGRTVHQIAQDTGRAWDTVERQIRDIRQLIIDWELEPWQK